MLTFIIMSLIAVGTLWGALFLMWLFKRPVLKHFINNGVTIFCPAYIGAVLYALFLQTAGRVQGDYLVTFTLACAVIFVYAVYFIVRGIFYIHNRIPDPKGE